MKADSPFRLEFRFVPVPIASGDEERVLAASLQAFSVIGSIVDANVASYSKPQGSRMVRLEADCVGDHQSVVKKAVEILGGTGWIPSGSSEEFQAIWSPHEGATPPVSVLATWAIVQSIPMRALPASHRAKLA